MFAHQHHNNNFDFLRLFASSAVLISHCYVIYDNRLEPLALLSGHLETLGGFSVSIFFIISGFLISASWDSQKDTSRFIINRSLRIFPALIVVVLLSALILGPIASTLNHQAYWQDMAWLYYLKNAFLILSQTTLPGVFEQNPVPALINGSLWTLPVEFIMYAITLVLGIFSLLNRKALPYVFLFILFFFLRTEMTEHSYGIPLWYALRCALFFIMGAILYFYFEQLKWDIYWFGFFSLLFVITLYTSFNKLFFLFYFPYLVIFIATKPIPLLKNISRYGDYSYGMYLYAFPISQYLRSIWPNAWDNLFLFIVATYSITLLLSILSWHLIEKPALANKKRLYIFLSNHAGFKYFQGKKTPCL